MPHDIIPHMPEGTGSHESNPVTPLAGRTSEGSSREAGYIRSVADRTRQIEEESIVNRKNHRKRSFRFPWTHSTSTGSSEGSSGDRNTPEPEANEHPAPSRTGGGLGGVFDRLRRWAPGRMPGLDSSSPPPAAPNEVAPPAPVGSTSSEAVPPTVPVDRIDRTPENAIGKLREIIGSQESENKKLHAAIELLRKYTKLTPDERCLPANMAHLQAAEKFFIDHFSAEGKKARGGVASREQRDAAKERINKLGVTQEKIDEYHEKWKRTKGGTDDFDTNSMEGYYKKLRDIKDGKEPDDENISPDEGYKAYRLWLDAQIKLDVDVEDTESYDSIRRKGIKFADVWKNLEDSRDMEDNIKLAEVFLKEAKKVKELKPFFEIFGKIHQRLGDPRRGGVEEKELTDAMRQALELLLKPNVERLRRNGDSESKNLADVIEFYYNRAVENLQKFHLSHLGYDIDHKYEVEGEFGLERKENYWRREYQSTYVITANNTEELEQAFESFFDSLTTKSPVHKNAQEIWQEIGFFTAGMPAVRERLSELKGTTDKNPTEREKEITGAMKLRVLAYAGFWFGRTGETDQFIQFFQYVMSDPSALETINASRNVFEGIGLLASRKMQTQEWQTIFRTQGEHGGLAEYTDVQAQVVDELKKALAKEIMIYEVRDDDPKSAVGRGGEEFRQKRIKELGCFQTDKSFMNLYKKRIEVIGEVKHDIEEIRDKQRSFDEGVKENKLTDEQMRIYNKALERAVQAVDFAYQIEAAFGDMSIKAAPSYIMHINKDTPQERKDYMSKEEIIRFVTFAESLAQIRGSNMKILDVKTKRYRKLNAKEMSILSENARYRARRQLADNGFKAKLTNEFEEELKVELTAKGLPDFDSLGLNEKRQPIHCKLVEQKGVKTIQEVDPPRPVSGEASKYKSFNFNEAASHWLAGAPDAAYSEKQAEKFRQFYRTDIRRNARKLRKGEISEEEAGFMATFLLMTDPGLGRLKKPNSTDFFSDRYKGILISERVGWNHQRRLRIQRELRDVFFGSNIDTAKTDVGAPTFLENISVAHPNRVFVTFKMAHPAEFIPQRSNSGTRRGMELVWASPDIFKTLSQKYGFVGLPGLLGVINLESEEAHKLYMEHIDVNVTGDWANELKRLDILISSIYGGTIDGKPHVPLFEKLTNDAEASIQQVLKDMERDFSVENHQDITSLIKYFGRLGVTLESITNAENARSGDQELFIEDKDTILIDRDENGEVKTDGNKYALEKLVKDDGKIFFDTGAGRITGGQFYDIFMDFLMGPMGQELYPAEWPDVVSLLKKTYRKANGGKMTGREWLRSKLVR